MILILVILHRQMLSTCSSMFIPRYRCTYYILRQDRAAYEYVTNIDKHTVPEGKTFGWNKGGVNLPVTS